MAHANTDLRVADKPETVKGVRTAQEELAYLRRIRAPKPQKLPRPPKPPRTKTSLDDKLPDIASAVWVLLCLFVMATLFWAIYTTADGLPDVRGQVKARNLNACKRQNRDVAQVRYVLLSQQDAISKGVMETRGPRRKQLERQVEDIQIQLSGLRTIDCEMDTK